MHKTKWHTKVENEKTEKIFHANVHKNKTYAVVLISDKIEFNMKNNKSEKMHILYWQKEWYSIKTQRWISHTLHNIPLKYIV